MQGRKKEMTLERNCRFPLTKAEVEEEQVSENNQGLT